MIDAKKIVEAFLEYLQQRDLNRIVNLFAENVKWQIPGNENRIAWLGKRNSRAEVEAFFKLLWSATVPLSASIHKILMTGSDVIIKGDFATKMLKTGKIVTSIFFIHFVVKEEKIVEYTLLEDSFAVAQAMEVG
ncbi:nuclear transport factor 2 family protein [Niabella digestorum]|uniref:Nuclear transport factor 2 family protein n=1 Tax=Niabella digestorum TaxID=3117701 RepID=A0ABU7RJ25_9BACT